MVVESMRNSVSMSLRSCYISACTHPLLMFMSFVLFWTYRLFPVLFSLLVDASPVIATTFVLLGTLLFYGQANAPKIQKEAQSHHVDVVDEETHYVNNMNVNEDRKKLIKEARNQIFVNRSKLRSSDVSRRSSFDPSRRSSFDPSRRSSFDPPRSVIGYTDNEDNNKGWETGSDVDQDSSPSGSMAENYPLFGQHQSETEDDDYDDEQHYGMEVKDFDEDETLIAWTEDDQRHLINLGTLELERNQRLERLIARQKAIINLAEKNMVNKTPDVGTFEKIASDTESIGSTHTSDISKHIVSRNRFSENDDFMKLHQVVKEADSSNEVKISGENTGNEDKTSNKPSSSSLVELTDDINNGDEDNKEEAIKKSSLSSDSKELQDSEASEDSESEEEEGLPQRILSWLTSW